MKKVVFIIFLNICALQIISAQFISKNDHPIFGFDTKISGADFNYHFPIPNISNSILVRGNKHLHTMVFLTKPVPLTFNDKTALFVFPFAIGSNAIPIHVNFYVNDVLMFRFDTKDNPKWKLLNSNGSELGFENIAYDGNRDMKGFLYLKLPTKFITNGKPVKIKLVAQDVDSQTWIILYKDEIKNEIKARLLPGIIESKGVEKQTVFIDVYHFAAPEKAVIKVDGKVVSKIELKLGFNQLSITVDRVLNQKEIFIEVEKSSVILSQKLTLFPTREWFVNFVQHSHTDIGYTKPQTEILAEHIRYIDYALDFCDLTENYSDPAKFRWTCEAAWAVEEYLLTRPKSQVDRLIERIQEGRIEVTAMMFNFDEIPDENILAASLSPLKTFKNYNIPSSVAMQNDVNGIGWCFVDYFPDLGVKYVNMGTHGHRALICFDLPTVFRWQSPSGKEMIAYRAEHYNKGNFVGIETDNFENFEVKLLDYLSSLEQNGYPHSLAQLQFSGYLIDNSPPSIQACENVRKWNEKYKFPKIKLALSSEFFEYFEKNHYDSLQIVKGAWPDWWTDGFGAAPREVMVTRFAQSDIMAHSSALALTKILGSTLPKGTNSRIDEVLKAILFYGEHTTGYSESVRDPECKQTLEQRALKESYAWEGYRKGKTIGETTQGLLQDYFLKSSEFASIVVTNTLAWTKSGVVKVYMDNEILPQNALFTIFDNQGNTIKAQIAETRAEGAYWLLWIDSIPAFSAKQLYIKILDIIKPNIIHNPIPSHDFYIAENQWYIVKMDLKHGTITQLYDKESNLKLIDSTSNYQLGEFIGERLAERSSLESKRMGSHERFPLDTISFIGIRYGDIYDVLQFRGKTKMGTQNDKTNFSVEIKIYKTSKLIELGFMINKNINTQPESFYIAMPFLLANGNIYCEVPGGVMQAGVDQIKGSANDWNTAQSFVSIKSDNSQIVVSSNETPLWHFGNINMGRYKAGAVPETTHLYSWPMNNYWVTNFNADIRGEINWSYFITSINNGSLADATKFGWNTKVPLLGRVLPKSLKPSLVKSPNFEKIINFHSDNILLVSMNPHETKNEIIIHVREISGTQVPLNITSEFLNLLKVVECNAIGEVIDQNPKFLSPKATMFLKLSWE